MIRFRHCLDFRSSLIYSFDWSSCHGRFNGKINQYITIIILAFDVKLRVRFSYMLTVSISIKRKKLILHQQNTHIYIYHREGETEDNKRHESKSGTTGQDIKISYLTTIS